MGGGNTVPLILINTELSHTFNLSKLCRIKAQEVETSEKKNSSL